VRQAIVSENIAVLKTAKGIGPKAAKRLVLELKDKVLKGSGAQSAAIATTLTVDNTVREEALSALVALGFNKTTVQKALNRILKATPTIKDSSVLIKQALGQLSS
jgi:Holliday junction DNA helicase RuvA